MPAQPAAVSIQLVGFDDLNRRLAGLPAKIERRALRNGLRASANKIKTKLKAATPRQSGFSAGRIVVQAKASVARGAYAVVKYSSLSAPGTRVGARGRMRMREYGNPAPGRTQRARPFFRAATAGWEADVQRQFREDLKAAVERNEG